MVVRADIGGTRPVAPVAAIKLTSPLGDAGQETYDRFSQFPAGKMLQAQVLSRLNDGSFMVKVADTPIRLNLPPGTQAGDTVELTLVATHPRPAFALPASNPASSPSLSNAARLISEALQASASQHGPAPLVGKAPLVPSSSASPVQVAAALKNSLTFSGLFYESHLYQWASGNRSLSDLMREPQARQSLPSLVAAALRANTSAAQARAAGPANGAPLSADDVAADADMLLPASRQAADTASSSQQAIRTLTYELPLPAPAATTRNDKAAVPQASDADTNAPGMARNESSTHVAQTQAQQADSTESMADLPEPAGMEDNPAQQKTGLSTDMLSNEMARMISMQLDTLEHRHLAWQGELWPGQPMEWDVTEETPKENAEEAESAWHSKVRFELPTLGTISASICLTGGRLQVHVRAADEVSASVLRANGNTLASALEAAGSALEILTVKHEDAF